ncbi:MAG: metallophosphoesterase [Alphaproteobacteria bacterium]|nr:metallophosphoesterase [Alphaproteobacteria bacterium]
MFVLAHLSDPHLAPLPRPRLGELASKRGLGYLNWLRKRRAIHRAEVLSAVVADLKANAPDHIAVTGDLVNLSLGAEFARARTWLEGLGSPQGVSVVPGNHDAYVRAVTGFAERDWGAFMRGDDGGAFPYVRRRGPVALIGLSTSLATLPLAATGRLHGGQLERLGEILDRTGRDGLFRTVLIHHPPTPGANRFRRLQDAAALRAVLHRHGAELVLHGHHHEQSVAFLDGLGVEIPCVGVPSASGAQGHHDDPAGFNLYEIGGGAGGWRCTMIARGLRGGGIAETGRRTLIG